MFSTAGITVLLVEDDAAVARATARALMARGHTVAVADSCAVALLVSATLRFEVGVFDIDLGDGFGTDCASELLRRGSVERCVFFTGGAPKRLLDFAATLGPVVEKDSMSLLLDAVAAR